MAPGKLLVLVGLLCVVVGLLLWWGGPVGRLPGDFTVRRGAVTFYVPLASAILLSVVITVLLALFRR